MSAHRLLDTAPSDFIGKQWSNNKNNKHFWEGILETGKWLCRYTQGNQNTTKGSFRDTWVYAFQQIAKRVNHAYLNVCRRGSLSSATC